MIKELLRWKTVGIDKPGIYAAELVGGNKIKKISAAQVNQLLLHKKYPLQSQYGQEYYLYFNVYPSTEYKAVLHINNDGEVDYTIKSCGYALDSYTYETIIFILEGERVTHEDSY